MSSCVRDADFRILRQSPLAQKVHDVHDHDHAHENWGDQAPLPKHLMEKKLGRSVGNMLSWKFILVLFFGSPAASP